MAIQSLDHCWGVIAAKGLDETAGMPQILAHPHFGQGDRDAAQGLIIDVFSP